MSLQGFWNEDWMALQRKYWENWTELSQQAMGGMQPMKSPWESAMDHWWQAIAPAAPESTNHFMDKMMEQGKSFFNMADLFSQKFNEKGGVTEWGDVFGKMFNDMQKSFSQATTGQGDDALHKMMAFWEMPLDNWQRMVSSLSLTPGDSLRSMHGMAPNEHLERFLSAPGLGYTREEQGQYQAMLQSSVNYQKAMQDYMQFFSNLGVSAVDRMRQKVEALGKEGKSIDSARQLYDTWVMACEEVYSEEVMTSEYAMLHGTLVNALMMVKHHMMSLVDEGCSALNMPTRTELNTLQTRMQENRREIKALRREIKGLKQQLAAVAAPAQKAEPKKAAAPKRRAAPKKKAASKA